MTHESPAGTHPGARRTRASDPGALADRPALRPRCRRAAPATAAGAVVRVLSADAPRRWRRSSGPASAGWSRWRRASSRSPTAPAASPRRAPTPPSPAWCAETSLVPAAHLTCVGASRAEVDEVARRYWEAGVRHIVALRGDPPPGEAYAPHPRRLSPTRPIWSPGCSRRAVRDLGRGLSGDASGRRSARTADLDNLKRKLDAGATPGDHQYFFDTDVYLRFLDRCLAAGITAPIVPGIMPVSNFAQAARFSALCGVERAGLAGADVRGHGRRSGDAPHGRPRWSRPSRCGCCRRTAWTSSTSTR